MRFEEHKNAKNLSVFERHKSVSCMVSSLKMAINLFAFLLLFLQNKYFKINCVFKMIVVFF